MSSFDKDENPNLFYGVIGASFIMFAMSICMCTWYCNHQLAAREEILRRQKLMAPVKVNRSGWIDPSGYNGSADAEPSMAELGAISRSETRIPSRQNTGVSQSQRRKISGNKRPTDLRTSKEDFKKILIQYYSKYAPLMTMEDVAVIVESHYDSQDLRLALDSELKREYGQGINEYVEAVDNGMISAPTQLLRSERDVAPSVQFVQDKPLGSTQDGVPMTLRTDLASALNSRGLSKYLDLFHDNGVLNITDLRCMDEGVVRSIFPPTIQQKILDMIQTASLLFIAENEPDI
mmetsp:Transcript_29550/g.36522  ORF Transcript_29550/g.36522 Transcript_29550/m.36522 type:complete len:291 (+) Transcript_29550:385-1257(+)|eukprot:CAMPEP_0204828568 /NCGR_PEP_ID=MMETSP1346-20131115/6413_1 /ASSEMBLY_ACC=CAM_ASM_000771 /TAXON_ID=215587 /ORGANISM="Aplanochytrium stocchinoi, Strain GSBS06" /LENGTH=290 /DNA_ID=CAMNT_0051957747 /DNA_START=314 /DNA_END=1186 /DNA_ORIENTATION=+